MNKAITEGLVLMPPPFADGLDVWSSEDGTPGSATYDGATNAAFVPADQDFGGRCFAEIAQQRLTTATGQLAESQHGFQLVVRDTFKLFIGIRFAHHLP